LFQVTAYSCLTFHIPYDTYNSEGLYVDYYDSNDAGYWGWYDDYYDECEDYQTLMDYDDYFHLDAPLKFGRAIGVIGNILGWVTLIMLLIASCVRYPRPKLFFRILGSCMFVMAVFSLLLLVGLASDPYDISTLPEMGGPAYCVIPGALFWIAAGVTTIVSVQERDFPVVVSAAAVHAEPVPVKHVEQLPPATVTKEIRERINDDGSKTVITTTRTTNPDGTVMEEIMEEEFPADRVVSEAK